MNRTLFAKPYCGQEGQRMQARSREDLDEARLSRYGMAAGNAQARGILPPG